MWVKDNKEYSEPEIKAENPNTIFGMPFDPSGLGYQWIFPVPAPTTTELKMAVRDGVGIDSKGNPVEKWKVVNMFANKVVDGVTITKATQEAEYLAQKAKAVVPNIISMRQARLALLNAGILSTVDTAIVSGTDETMKIDWEYATEVKREWASLNTMATTLGLTTLQLDQLFIDGAKL